MAPTLPITSTIRPTGSPLIKCPIFTHSGYDADNHIFFCVYQSWAYGVFAIAGILLIMIPLVSLICCIARFRASKRYIRRLTSTAGTDSYITPSDQPFLPEETHHQNVVYGSIEPFSPPQSPTADSISEHRSESHDNVSVVSSRASLVPNYDQASLDLRNNKTGSTFQNSYACPEPVERPERHPPSGDAVNPCMIYNPNISRNKNNLPIYIVPEKASPTQLNLPTNQPEYAVLEKPTESTNDTEEKTVNKLTTSDKEGKTSHKPLAVSSKLDNEKVEGSSTNSIAEGLQGALVEVPNSECESNAIPNKASSKEPVDKVFQPTTPSDIPELANTEQSEQNLLLEDKSYQRLFNEKQKEPSVDHKSDSNKDKEITAEPRYMSLFPTEESTQPLTKQKTKSRTDYQEILLDAIKSYPLDERNGCFIMCDSISSPGSKALTVYNKTLDSQQEFYNFKICFDDTGLVYLAKSMKRFSAIEELLAYLRHNKDMLPCTLRSQIA